MFADFGAALPIPTQIIVGLSQFAQQNFLYGLAFIAIIIFAFKKYYATEKGEKKIDAMVLQLPVIGDLVRKVAVAKFTRTPC
jgi:type IV pilus assembly protein PilC